MAQNFEESLRNPDTAAPENIMKAIAAYKKLTSLDPKDSAAFLSLANLSFSFGVIDKAVSYYNQYLELVPADHSVRSQYAHALLLSGDAANAVAELDRVVAAQPNQDEAWLYLAVAHTKLGNAKDAAAARKEALLRAPSDEERKQIESFLDGLTFDKQEKTQAATGKVEG
jgi:predicted Zn-dependent protease